MTLALVWQIVRDVFLVAVVGFLFIHTYKDGERMDQQKTLAALQKQVENNARQITAWQQQQLDAKAIQHKDMTDVQKTIDLYASRPVNVLVRNAPSNPSPVPSAPAPAVHEQGPACSGGVHEGDGSSIDVRPNISALERKGEAWFGICRAILDSWPK